MEFQDPFPEHGTEGAELVFIPGTSIGHLVSAIGIAKLLINRCERLSITIFIMKLSIDVHYTAYTESLDGSYSDRIRFIDLPAINVALNLKGPDIVNHYMNSYKPIVKQAVSERVKQSESGSSKLAGLVVDMFSTTMIDVAKEFGLPIYVIFTSNASCLRLMFYLQKLEDEENINITDLVESGAEMNVPSFVNLVPCKVLPCAVIFKDTAAGFINFARRYRETKGIIVNTFLELELRAINSILDDVNVPLYPVGPILNLESGSFNMGSHEIMEYKEIMHWLDDQPSASVVFLCFGSLGSFGVDQVQQIAYALERSRHRFLWSLRKPPATKVAYPLDYANHQEVLPQGFVDRTTGIGKVIGWAPQVAVLAHRAIGGFVSHCGWNSILESIWFGVPIATWPIYAEQQFNAFQLVRELGLGVEIKMDYRNDIMTDTVEIVSSEEIERGIRCLMEEDSNERRKKVRELSRKSKEALLDGGSSYSAFRSLIRSIMQNMQCL